ncbi:MAG: hypothetical protein JWM53_2106 [bacterium]|nr:hypothetical protein [bacterium]
MSAPLDQRERTRLEELAAKLRDATCAALAYRSALARSLDESRGELERMLMLNVVDAIECRRVVIRAQMTLDAWRSMAAVASARPR